MEQYLRENCSFGPEINNFRYCAENGKFNFYYCERGCNSLWGSYETYQELMERIMQMSICVPGKKLPVSPNTATTLEELDRLLKEKNEGYLRPFPYQYEYSGGKYKLFYCEGDEKQSVDSFDTCERLSKYLLKLLEDTIISRTFNLNEHREAERELIFRKVNYKERTYLEKGERSVYMFVTWRDEIRKIKDYNWFHDTYNR